MMVSASQLQNLLGEWSGSNQLWISPHEEAYASASTAAVSLVAQGRFLTVAYTWAIEEEPHDGLIIFRREIGDDPSTAVWLDSWHTRDGMMLFDGTRAEGGVVSLEGTYPAPPGPDWGWRIELEQPEDDALEVRMFNISPQGEEALAVLARYERSRS